jgi:nucleoside-diphosphate-sugar epimerase
MAAINIKIVDNLLIVTPLGELTSEEVIAVINEYYPDGTVKDVIWDLTGGSLRSMSTDDFIEIAKAAKRVLDNGARKDGRTVYVGNSEIEYDLLRMYATIAEKTGVPVKYEVFRTVEEVKNWIK